MQDLQASQHDFKILTGLPCERPSVPFLVTSRTGPDQQYSWMYIDKSEISGNRVEALIAETEGK